MPSRAAVVLLLASVVVQLCATLALYSEDAGRLDFMISTAGHGPTTVVYPFTQSVITSDSGSHATKSSCFIASRDILSGKILWRRNVCSKHGPSSRHDTSAGKNCVVTVDDVGVVNAWSTSTGDLLWSNSITPLSSTPSVLVYAVDEEEIAAVSFGSATPILFDIESGASIRSLPPGATLPKRIVLAENEVMCTDFGISILIDSNNVVVAYSSEKGAEKNPQELPFSGDFSRPSADRVIGMYLVSCSPIAAQVLIATQRGTTSMIEISRSVGDIHIKTLWKQEEGLSAVSAAMMIDASHMIPHEAANERLLETSSRLLSQWRSLCSLWRARSSSVRSDSMFGFVKIGILLSQSLHRVYGVEIAGLKRGSVLYQVDLADDADWHRIIHGGPNLVHSIHGNKGGAHSRDLLLISFRHVDLQLSWICLDGASGVTQSEGFLSLPSAILQIVPMGGKGSCAQSALVLLEDESVFVIPDDSISRESASSQILESENGFFVHSVRKELGKLTSFHLDSEFGTRVVGDIIFPGETVVAVSYPKREETIQSPCNVLGDDSLLLKYVSPHVAAVVTMSDDGDRGNITEMVLRNEIPTSSRRKPVGVNGGADEGVSRSLDDSFNFFVNVVDLVSGRVLYRIGHADALNEPRPCVLVSENWIYYTFAHRRSKRASVGVLSLYEGMIGSTGLTAFTSLEQANAFTSFDARESKPETLAKTFSVPLPVTALGMTTTRSGISSHKLILATAQGGLLAVDRKMLDPRRPIGQLKDTEKKEGLHQYTELLAPVSYMSLSHNFTVESVKGILAAPTDLESQSLVLAYGGPDIFFTRVSPSRGFDLLPDSFNRLLLIFVVAILMITLGIVKHIATQKLRKQGWV